MTLTIGGVSAALCRHLCRFAPFGGSPGDALRIKHSNHLSHVLERPEEIPEGTTRTVVLDPRDAIHAVVKGAGSARGLHYLLRAQPLAVPRWEPPDGRGCYLTEPDSRDLCQLPPGRYAVLVTSRSPEHEDWVLARAEVDVVAGADNSVTLELPEHFEVRGRIGRGGERFAGQPLYLSHRSGGREYLRRVVVGEDGRFSVTLCVRGRYIIRLFAGGKFRQIGDLENQRGFDHRAPDRRLTARYTRQFWRLSVKVKRSVCQSWFGRARSKRRGSSPWGWVGTSSSS